MPKRTRIPFFTDQNVPESACRILIDSGHSVTRLREVMAENSPDPVVAVACSVNSLVLVSHDSDFRSTAKLLKVTKRQFREKLHRVSLRCSEPTDAERLKDAMSIIEHEWGLVRGDRPMQIEIRQSTILVRR